MPRNNQPPSALPEGTLWSGLRRIHPPLEWRLWGFFVLVFTVTTSLLLVGSRGLPYGLDGNESFSNITHARAIAHYGVIRSVGLTDETAATHPGASPYIHSHQGNFPRIFSTLIYFFGARSIESQLWVTTLIVGLSAFWFAFAYLARRTNPWFALLACLVMVADYLLVLQWHLNSYRVWHAWFFFAVLCWVDRGDQPRGRGWNLSGVLLFAALFYWEYVFGFFLGVLAAVYALLVNWRYPRRWLSLWTVEIAGGLVAIGVLLTQLTLYMGWSNVLLDIQYTLQARNSAESQVLSQRIADFYDKHHVLFWPNYTDASVLRTASRLADSFLQDHLKYYTPPLVMLLLCVGSGWLVGLWSGRRTASGSVARRSLVPPMLRGGLNWLLLGGLAVALARPFLPSLPTVQLVFAVVIVLACITLILRRTAFRWARLSTGRLAGGCLLVSILTRFCSVHFLHQGLFADIWNTATGIRGSALAMVEIAGVVLALLLGLAGVHRLLGTSPRANLSGLAPLFLATLVGFILTYWIFAGYVFSGYLHRQAPFLVFATDLALAMIIYVSVRVGWTAAALFFKTRSDHLDPGHHIGPGRIAALSGGVLLAALVGGVASFGWLQVQRHYARLVPLNGHAYLQDLAKPPFKGRSFVVNTYASPISVQTGSWAMMEPVLFTGQMTLTPRGYEIPRESTYKWFADREANPAYLKPEFALYQRPSGWSDVAESHAWAGTTPARKFNLREIGLISRAALPFTQFLHPRLVALDDSDRQRFAIVALDWDYPAYLAELPAAVSPLLKSGRASLAAMETSGTADWRIRLEVPHLQPGQHVALQRIETPRQNVDLAALPIKDAAWQTNPATGALTTTAYPAVLAMEAHGPALELEFRKGPAGGRVHVWINETKAELNLHADTETTEIHRFESPDGGDGLVTLPRSIPGQFVAADVRNGTATLAYAYRHQEAAPESQTLISLYRQDEDGLWRLHREYTLVGRELRPVDTLLFRQENPDALAEYRHATAHGDTRSFVAWLADHLAAHPEETTHPGLQSAWDGPMPPADEVRHLRLSLPAGLAGTFRFGVRPGTGRKLGPEYFSNPFTLGETSAEFGPVRLRLRLDATAGPHRQPLLLCGSSGAGSLVWLQHEGNNRIRLGLDAGALGSLLSEPVEFDPLDEQSLEISHGSLFPLADDPRLRALDENVQAGLRRFVRILWNNQPVIEADLQLPPITSRAIKWGRAADFPDTADRLAGEILSVERHWPESFAAYERLNQSQASRFGPLSFDVRFPTGLAGRSEPLVTSGVTGAGDFLYVHYLDDRHIRLGFDHWGVKGFLGEPIEIEPGRWYRLTASMGSLYPPEVDVWFVGQAPAIAQMAKGEVRVFLDDRPVFFARSPAYESPPRFVTPGENHIGGSSAGPTFSGTIRDVQRLPLAEFPPNGPPR